MTKTVLLVAVAAIAFVLLRRFQQPKANTARLAMTVWAGFGPHRSAEDAEDTLRRACLAVFGPQRIREHESWMNGHIENFREAEKRGTFQRVQKIMRAGLLLTAYGRPYQEACEALRAHAAADAQAAFDSLAQQFPQLEEFRGALQNSLPPGSVSKPREK
jgi:hypothetical protein